MVASDSKQDSTYCAGGAYYLNEPVEISPLLLHAAPRSTDSRESFAKFW